MATFGNMADLWNWYQYWATRPNKYQSGIARMVNGVFSTDCNGIIKMYGYTHNNPSLVPTPTQNCPNYREGIVIDEWIGAWYDKATNKGLINTIPKTGYSIVYIDKTAKYPDAWNHVGIYNASTNETFEMCALGIRKVPLDATYWNKWSNLYWCPDLSAQNVDVIVSYVKDGVDYSKVFEPTYYSNKYPDLKLAFGLDKAKLFNHFINHGMSEKRQAIESFDINIYRQNYVDLRNAFGDDYPKYYIHWCQYGIKEGRNAITVIKPKLTATSYPDYKGSDVYRVRKSYNDSKSSVGSWSKWASAYNTWNANKSSGYHVYDKNGRQLD